MMIMFIFLKTSYTMPASRDSMVLIASELDPKRFQTPLDTKCLIIWYTAIFAGPNISEKLPVLLSQVILVCTVRKYHSVSHLGRLG